MELQDFKSQFTEAAKPAVLHQVLPQKAAMDLLDALLNHSALPKRLALIDDHQWTGIQFVHGHGSFATDVSKETLLRIVLDSRAYRVELFHNDNHYWMIVLAGV